MTETPAQRLKLARVAAGYRTARQFSDRHRIPQSTYALHESGGRELLPKVAERYAQLLGNVSAAWLLHAEGRSPARKSSPEAARPITAGELTPIRAGMFFIIGNVEPGVWREAPELPDEEREAVSFEDRPEYRDANRFALRLRGPSMDRHYAPNTILDCVSFASLTRLPRDGDHVIVYRNGPENLTETTVKELVRQADHWQLWPRSNHPAHQTPLDIHHPPEDLIAHPDEAGVRIVALVIGSYQRRP